MFAIYLQTIQTLGYPQELTATDDLWDCGIDELAGFIAQTDSESDMLGFFAKCDRLDWELIQLFSNNNI